MKIIFKSLGAITFILCIVVNLSFTERLNNCPANHVEDTVKTLSGAWQITLTMEADPNLPFIPPKIVLLANLTSGGDFIASTDLPVLNVPFPDGSVIPLKIGTGHGIWIKKSDNKFDLKIKRIVQLAEAPQSLFGFVTGDATVSFKDDTTLTGKVKVQLFAADGTAIPPAYGKFNADRLFVEK